MATGTRTGRRSRAGQGRYARSTSTPRRLSPTQGLRRRRQPEPSGLKKALSTVLPTGAAKKAAPTSKKGKAGGLALAVAAAGMALKNRGEISKLRRKRSGAGDSPTGSDGASAPPGV